MILVVFGVALIVMSLVVFFTYRFLKRRRKRPLKKGDYVMFKRRYKAQFPTVPTTHAMVIENIMEGKATLVFMTNKNQVLKETVPLDAVTRAS